MCAIWLGVLLAGLFQRVETLENKQTETEKKLDVVLDKLEELSPAVTSEQLFATGCVWDAYSYVCDLVRSAARRIVQLPLHVHDRFLIIDSQVYLLGASVKDMGKGLCAIAPVGFSPEMVLGLMKGK